MEIRKVVKIRSSYFINIPAAIAEDLKIEKGDSLRVGNLPGYGIIITRDKGLDKISVKLESVARLQTAADNIFSELKRKARSLESSFTFNIGNRIIGELLKTGWFDPKIGVEEVKSRSEKLSERSVKLVLLSNKKGTH
jgi:bifunctional DNA-binding transcriptional regulator/antitoxin component of YhaV-PrlF toxin-antitoxin module